MSSVSDDDGDCYESAAKRRCLDTSGDSGSGSQGGHENSPEQTVPSGGHAHSDGLSMYGHQGNAYYGMGAGGLCPPYYAPQAGYYNTQTMDSYQAQMGYS